MEGHAAVVATLLAKGALVDKADNEGSAPLHAAAAMGHEAVVEKPEPWPDTWTLVSIDTRTHLDTLDTSDTSVYRHSSDTPPTLLRHTQTLQTGNSDS